MRFHLHERFGTDGKRRAAAALAVCCAVLALGCRSASSPGSRTSAPPNSTAPAIPAPPITSQAQRQAEPPDAASSDGTIEPLDPTALPSVQPAHCAAVGRGKVRRVLSESERKPLLEAAQSAWKAEGDSMAPLGCVEQVSVSCGTDLDGEPGPEVLGEIRYLAGTDDCTTARRRGVSSTHALLAFVPPGPDSSAWRSLGLIGYSRFDVGGVESPAVTELNGFVRLPNERTALRVTRANDGADCSGQRLVEVLTATDGALSRVATKELRGCNAR